MSDLRYWTLKHNPLTSRALSLLTGHRGDNLKTLVFTATTGRSGTKSLARIFSAVDDCVAFHEPHPVMNGATVTNASAEDDPYIRYLYRTVKSVNIRRYAGGAQIYFESNHLFIKSFYPHVIRDFPGMVKVVHVYRDPVAVANSMHTIGNYPGTDDGNTWWLDFNGPENLINLADALNSDERFLHPFYKCLWYWYEIEARTIKMRHDHPDVPVFEFRTEDIRDKEKVELLLRSLEIPCDSQKIEQMTKVHTNLMTFRKKNPPLETHRAEEMHDKFRELLRSQGHSFEVD